MIKKWHVSILLMIPIGVIYALVISVHWKPTWDSATYIMLGKSLITFNGFKYMGIPHTKYPFMFPLMLAPIIGIFGKNFLLMRIFIVLTALGSIYLTYWLFSRKYNFWFGMGMMLMTAASFPLMFESTRILSDIPYMFFSLLALVFIRRYAKEEHWKNKNAYISVILMLVSFFTRYIGMALFAGTMLYMLINSSGNLKLRFKKIVFIGIIFLIPASAWMIRGAVIRHINPHPPGLREFLSYEKELVVTNPSDPHSDNVRWNNFVSRIKNNEIYYERLIGDIIHGKSADMKTRSRILSIIFLVGFVYCLIRYRDVFEYYVFFYILTYILWTSLQGHRFLVPMIPFIFYYFVKAVLIIPHVLRLIINKIKPSEHVWFIIKSTLVVLMAFLAIYLNFEADRNIIKAERIKPYYTGTLAEFLNSLEWIKDNTSPDTVIISGRSPWVYMITERKTFTPPWVNNIQEVAQSIEENKANYVISSPAVYSSQFLTPLIQQKPEMFDKVHQIGSCVIYKVL
ncbi:hypothetical protein GF312_08610 [Candidatus Poribacteria bacterium]|nr:hypothetical protein [Candidatus Poribacteria bacterium]